MGLRARIAVVTVIAVLGVVPIVADRDSYPISTLPMFARDRSRTETVDTAVAVGAVAVGAVALGTAGVGTAGVGTAGKEAQTYRLDPQRIAATPQPVTAAVVVSLAIARGEAAQLCAEIAERVARSGPDDASTIEVVTERYDAVDWFDGDRTPIERVVHATCAVSR
jgi:hypothetical protein